MNTQHRSGLACPCLSATPKDKKFEAHNTPFCLLLFRNTTEAARFSRALFHNINYKSVPLTMEQNLKLILDDSALFPDTKLKEHESFGWPYYHSRKLHAALDFDIFGNLKPFIEKEPRSFLVGQFTFLIQSDVLGDNENAVPRFKTALVKVNGLFVDWFHDGTSYEINDKIIEMMSDCGLLIGNLTHCNPNVYHEVGFVMGKAKAEGKDVANMLLFLDESIVEDKDKVVGFNLRGIKQLRFTRPEIEFAPALKENLERFFKLKV